MWEIKKRYDADTFNDDETSLGYPIDVFQESINKTFREYLVNYEYLTRVLENYGFALLSTEEYKDLNLPSSSGLFNSLHNMMVQESKKKHSDWNLHSKRQDTFCGCRQVY